jgi:hypothetical protein
MAPFTGRDQSLTGFRPLLNGKCGLGQNQSMVFITLIFFPVPPPFGFHVTVQSLAQQRPKRRPRNFSRIPRTKQPNTAYVFFLCVCGMRFRQKERENLCSVILKLYSRLLWARGPVSLLVVAPGSRLTKAPPSRAPGRGVGGRQWHGSWPLRATPRSRQN